MSEIITITESAEKYLAKLLDEKKDTNMAVRVFVSDPGTPKAETCLAFVKLMSKKARYINRNEDLKSFCGNSINTFS